MSDEIDGLVVNRLAVARAGSVIVHDVSLTAPPGQVTVLLGTNGAGKTSLLEAISGILPAQSGAVHLNGTDITRLVRSRRARLGLAHIEQGRAIFPDLTTEENLLVAGRRSAIEPAFELFPALSARRNARAGLLSGGEQQMLVIARSLVNQPKVLMVDEMSLGLAPIVIKNLMPVVTELAAQGVAVLLVEQYARMALTHGHRAYVLAHGRVAYEGGCQELIDDQSRLQALYLGAQA